jgi:hypothetical protein
VEVGPVLYLDQDETIDRATARAELGLDQDHVTALVQLGAGNINDVTSDVGAIVDRLGKANVQTCVTRSVIADTHHAPDHVRSISVYPLARYLRAFDFAVAASGYNTFHELISAGVPTIFLPNLETSADDQLARADFAASVGAALCVPEVTAAALDDAVRTMLDPEERARMTERCLERSEPNGAADAMSAIETLIDGERSAETDELRPAGADDRRPAAAPTAELTTVGAGWTRGGDEGILPARSSPTTVVARRAINSVRGGVVTVATHPVVRAIGRWPFRILPYGLRATVRRLLRRWERGWDEGDRGPHVRSPVPVSPGRRWVAPPGTEVADVPVVAVVLRGRGEQGDLGDLVAHVSTIQALRSSFRPLFVTDNDDFTAFREHGYQFEYLLPQVDLDALSDGPSWEDYAHPRLSLLMGTYGASGAIDVPAACRTDEARQMLTSLLPSQPGVTSSAS